MASALGLPHRNTDQDAVVSPVQKLRAMLEQKDKIVVCPGVFDGLTARIALQAGFDCLYMVRHQSTNARWVANICV
jgi:2-methylisocitrate lyase-like PEP mutase family enzyme